MYPLTAISACPIHTSQHMCNIFSARGVVMGSQANTQPLGGTAIKPEGWDRTGMEAFLYFLFNPKTGEILSRTPLSWIKIIVFYIIYYSCLAFFWCLCLFIFGLTIPDINTGPKWKLDNGIIGIKNWTEFWQNCIFEMQVAILE